MSREANINKALAVCASMLVCAVLISAASLFWPDRSTRPDIDERLALQADKEAAPVTSKFNVKEPSSNLRSIDYSSNALQDMRSAMTGFEIEALPIPDPPVEQFIQHDEINEDPVIPNEVNELVEAPDLAVSKAIEDYVSGIQSDLNREYVEGCLRFRNRGGGQGKCPENEISKASVIEDERKIADEIFLHVTRENKHAAIARSLEMENDTLVAVLEGETTASAEAQEQASIRLDINNRYLAYLGGNQSPLVAAHNVATGFINDYGRTVLPRPVQFQCPLLEPCIYEFTGFEVKRPESYESSPFDWDQTMPLFRSSK